MKKMIRYCFFIVVILGSLSFMSCVSQPSYERLTSDDCVVLIPSTLSNRDGAPTLREYYLYFSDSRERVKIGTKSVGYVAVLIRSGGLKINGISSNVSGNAMGDSFKLDLNKDIPYKRGEVIVADYTFEQRIRVISDITSQSSWNFVETRKEDIQKYKDLFLKTKEGRSWAD